MAKLRNGNRNRNGRRHTTQQSVDQAVKSICDIMRRGNCAGAMQYVPELTWILFLRILDEKENREEQEAEALGVPFRRSLEAPYRWRDWAAPTNLLVGAEYPQELADLVAEEFRVLLIAIGHDQDRFDVDSFVSKDLARRRAEHALKLIHIRHG